jgi:rfaE bifunctional protein nucleotidyltransferase chain/domain
VILQEKIKILDELIVIREHLRKENRTVVFTNGVFDILHRGHVEYLYKARTYGDVLILGLNSDRSVRIVKGKGKPLITQENRAVVLAGLASVDYICIFDEETPLRIIQKLQPDVLVKGGDYGLGEIVGREVVESAGGEVLTIPLIPDLSTTDVIAKVKKLIKEGIIML